jgi:hypothetical protein
VIGRVEGMNLAGGYRMMRYECSGSPTANAWVFPAVTLHEMTQ